MKSKLLYFIFNKDRDYSRGSSEGVTADREGIRLGEGLNRGDRGVYITRVLDSREKDTEWHRLTFDVENPYNTPYTITVYASNTLELACGGKRVNLAEFIADESVDAGQKLDCMEALARKRVPGTRDILLHEVKGRYLWLAAELYRQGGASARLSQFCVFFPRQSWISCLPEVYQANDKSQFLERYLAIFQTLYEDLNRAVGQAHYLLDADTAAKDYLGWLAGWIDVAETYMWSEDQLRLFLLRGVELYRKRGTREGILDFIRLYTGGDAYLVEYHQLDAFMKQGGQKGILTRLYGLNPRVLSVILKKEHMLTQKEYKSLIRVIEEIKPAQMELNLVILEPYLFLGGHSYLGVNSCLGEYRGLALDGLSMMPFSYIQS